MIQAGAHVKEEVVNSLIVLITNAEDLHGYAVRQMYQALQQNLATADASLMIAAVWCIGEFGEMLPQGESLQNVWNQLAPAFQMYVSDNCCHNLHLLH